MSERVILVVLDSVGIGELPDAASFGDEGSDTIGNIAKKINGFDLPNLRKLGLGNIDNGGHGLDTVDSPIGVYGKAMEVSKGKDTTTGHWEIAGIQLEKPFPTYPEGFPKEIINAFESKIGTKTLANCTASGTEIIQRLGDEHVKTGYPIVYTSADSVFQIAAHEDVYPIEKLYEMCRIAREILCGEHAVGRVIARPFIGKDGEYKRTSNRRDFSVEPTSKTILNVIKDNGLDVCAVGKIEDIFAGSGITDAVHTKNNMEGVDRTLDYMKQDNKGIIFTNLVDFDMLFGHRNDVHGYANALKEFDMRLPEIMDNMKDDDVLIITADHGCDPTTPSTDHSREHIPVLVYGKKLKRNVNLGVLKTYADIGKTTLDLLGLDADIKGESFASLIK